ncbi:MAG: carboxypeptidase regulatory-like domain-containing protein, partial [Vicinamibacterales bacterium]
MTSASKEKWHRRRAASVTTLVLVLVLALGGAARAGQPATGIIQGTVIDGASGQPLARVLILDEGNGQSASSDAEGRFELTLPVGARQLRASAVGFVLVRREIRIVSGGRILVTIPLTGGTGTYVESVTVAGDPFRRTDSSAPALQVLDSGDIQNLRGV